MREAAPEDTEAILALAGRSLGWAVDERDRAFFEWKHRANPFGPSPSWVAEAGGEVIGFRTFMRWQFVDEAGGRISMVRAVDTATDPDHQGKGVFRRLTLTAVEALTTAGVDAVFNTPNDQSRPGYLKMGWVELGRPSLGVIVRSPLPVLRAARGPDRGDKWGTPAAIGAPASEALADPSVARVLASLPPTRGLSTPRTLEHLRWRYSFDPLHYRVIEVNGGLCVFRVRQRGASAEVDVCEWLSASPDVRALRRLVRHGGDYGVSVDLGWRHGALPAPRQGPIVTWRPMARPTVPSMDEIHFSLGDLELF